MEHINGTHIAVLWSLHLRVSMYNAYNWEDLTVHQFMEEPHITLTWANQNKVVVEIVLYRLCDKDCNCPAPHCFSSHLTGVTGIRSGHVIGEVLWTAFYFLHQIAFVGYGVADGRSHCMSSSAGFVSEFKQFTNFLPVRIIADVMRRLASYEKFCISSRKDRRSTLHLDSLLPLISTAKKIAKCTHSRLYWRFSLKADRFGLHDITCWRLVENEQKQMQQGETTAIKGWKVHWQICSLATCNPERERKKEHSRREQERN